MRLYLSQDASLTQEYFFSKKPTSQKIFIWIITGILSAVAIWVSFAKFEEVIKVSGLIRPIDNISSVSNAVTGRIKEIDYKQGQQVKAGQMLLRIDPTQLESQKESILVQTDDDKKHLDYLNAIQGSIDNKKNIIPKEYVEAYLRYELWINTLKKLSEIRNMKYKAYKDEKKLPSSMTTTSKLRECESQYFIAGNDYENTRISFMHDIASEINSYTSSYEMNLAKLKQIEDSLLYTQITAPIDGIIQEKKAFNVNDWVQAGQELFNIIPIEKTNNKVELYIPAKQAGKIAMGMKVKMRFPSLPYHEFGGCEGKIVTIDPDVTKNTNGEAYFIVLADMEKSSLKDKNGGEFPLKVGLQTDARIILSEKTVLLFFLEKMNLCY